MRYDQSLAGTLQHWSLEQGRVNVNRREQGTDRVEVEAEGSWIFMGAKERENVCESEREGGRNGERKMEQRGS